ncbi:hypothetical protein D3C78_1512130 [compost metagenome]
MLLLSTLPALLDSPLLCMACQATRILLSGISVLSLKTVFRAYFSTLMRLALSFHFPLSSGTV